MEIGVRIISEEGSSRWLPNENGNILPKDLDYEL